MGLVRVLRFFGSMALAAILASCTSSGGALHSTTEPPGPTTSTTTAGSTLATVCGYEIGVGGPPGPRGPPAFAHECLARSLTSGRLESGITITARSGQTYVVYASGFPRGGLWSARLPPGTYHAVGWDCFSPGIGFVLRAGETLRSVPVGTDCSAL